jgi:MFS family permease
MIGETLFALGHSLISGTDQAFLYDSLNKLGKREQISKFAARNRSFNLLGITLSAPLGSLIGSNLTLNMVMILMFIPFSIAVVISISLKEPLAKNRKLESETYFHVIKTGLKKLRNNSSLRILAFDLIMVESLIFFLLWTYQVYLEKLNFPLELYGFISSSMTISQIIFTNLIHTFNKRLNNASRFLQIYTIIPGVGFILMAFIYFTPVSIALILIVIGFGFTRNILFINGINKQIESKNRATVISTINMIRGLVHSILYPLIGNLVVLNLSLTFIILGVMVLLIGIFTRVKEKHL